MFLGYNTNGFAHHELDDAIANLAEFGYGGVAITLDYHHLNPFAPDLEARCALLRLRLRRHGLKCVIETGSRFLLDPRRKHQPTLISTTAAERVVRANFISYCMRAAVELCEPADCIVSLWSGAVADDATAAEHMSRLVDGCRRLADSAAERNVRLAFEPEPGMFIDTMDKFAELYGRVNHPAFGLTIDVGHLVCNGELPVSKFLAEWKHVLWNVHIEDMRRGVHDHIMFGDGEVDFADVFAGLKAAAYSNGVYVELSRHSHDAVNIARRSKQFLDQFMSRS